jgi:hypothetical protein
MELEFKQRYERQPVPSSLTLQSSIIELSQSLPQQTEVKLSLFKRLLNQITEYGVTIKQPVFAGAFASVLFITGCVFLLKTVVFNEQINQSGYAEGVLVDKPDFVEGSSSAKFSEFSSNDYDWQEVVLIEDEMLLAGL